MNPGEINGKTVKKDIYKSLSKRKHENCAVYTELYIANFSYKKQEKQIRVLFLLFFIKLND